jgi:uncharacterized protein (TIGR02452 family)
MEWIAAGGYVRRDGTRVELRALIDAAIASTWVLPEAEAHAAVAARPAPPAGLAPRVECWTLRSGACVQRLLAEGAARVAVLNYANGVTPGGAFLRLGRAQEEGLCRCSALYPCLAQDAAPVRFFYDDNRAARSALVRGHVLISPDVPFFRDEALAVLDAPFLATVLTAAAPDLGLLGGEPHARFDKVPDVFRRRTLYVLEAARRAGCDAVVLGPWGCGAFGNDPGVVADAFASALARHADGFARVVFSLWGAEKNRAPFERRFAPMVVRPVR